MLRLLEPILTLTNIFYQNQFFSISYYTLCFLLAFVTIFFTTHHTNKAFHVSSKTTTEITLILITSGLLGGRLGHILFYDINYFSSHPNEIFALWHGGLSSFGAFVLGGMTLYFYGGRRNWWLHCDFVVLHIPIVIFFVRIGNFINHEIVGKNFYDLLPTMLVSVEGKTEMIVPIVLYEAFLCGLVLFLILLSVHKRLQRGMSTVYFLFLYSIMRFPLEFFKPDEKVGLGLNISQLFSLVLLVWSILLYVRIKKIQ